MRRPISHVCGLGLLGAVLVPSPAAADVAVWVYDAHRWSAPRARAELGALPGGARRLYLSVEDGPRLLTDTPPDARRLGALLDLAHRDHGLHVEAMVLQDAGWARHPEAAAARAQRVLAFQRVRVANGRPGFAGLHVDIEPHVEEAWVCGTARTRRRSLRALQQVFARIARLSQESPGEPLRLTAALPWWIGPLSAQVPEARPAAWLAHLDEAVLMVYGEPGGPLVGESAPAVLRRLDDRRLWAGLPAGRGLRIGLATYEHTSPAALRVVMEELAAALHDRPGFRGFAVFAHGLPFDAPRVAVLRGRVVDRAARPVANARVHASGRTARSRRCGVFTLRGLPTPSTELRVEAAGFWPMHLPVRRLVPGRQRELGPIVLERRP